ncbi:heme NO-binding domain-containing protein [Thermogemmatispora sp.]|uniref:heme NO-binding domain-containing protein n=1 Tax=Thermogemmatispora sp. TaxID=1968838 RepID=UPI001D6CB27E|nr:heme NO-binding domain-containing protein [Thermogemmatispora sp.]MBX5449772.1 heme NO-binding domain-containing protein [Thermogemmatispora sp.]
MHGLIFATWEKYLAERFGGGLLSAYREAIGESPSATPLVSRFYDDHVLLEGVATASRLSGLSPDQLLREYGRYFILNSLTGHLCKYILSGVNSAYDLLLTMRDVHSRLRKTAAGLTPPLFNYEFAPDERSVVLIYDSPRQLCAVLWGAIEGAAERYGEEVAIYEQSCMKRGDSVCRLEATFARNSRSAEQLSEQARANAFEQQTHQNALKELGQRILTILPTDEGRAVTLSEIRQLLVQRYRLTPTYQRPAVLLQVLRHLQFAGYVAASSNQPDDNLTTRRYWRVTTYWEH